MDTLEKYPRIMWLKKNHLTGQAAVEVTISCMYLGICIRSSRGNWQWQTTCCTRTSTPAGWSALQRGMVIMTDPNKNVRNVLESLVRDGGEIGIQAAAYLDGGNVIYTDWPVV